jgi:hypothetical protein
MRKKINLTRQVDKQMKSRKESNTKKSNKMAELLKTFHYQQSILMATIFNQKTQNGKLG